jgi:FKBP-type peptidyl-prolyl cis-trans isomerase
MNMKKLFVAMCCCGLTAPLFADGTNQLADEKSRVSYAIGLNLGHSLKQSGADVDLTVLSQGVRDQLEGRQPMMTDAQVRDTITTYQRELRSGMLARNKAAGFAFLATNKAAAGVQVLSVPLSGGASVEMQYLVITNGTGPKPSATDQVTVNYRGTLLDGTEFDSSYKRGQPVPLSVSGVIKGWTAALQQMAVGSKWKLFIPAELAYGENGRPSIPPNSLLIFEIELLSIGAPAPAPASPAQPLTSDIIKVPSADEMKKGAQIEVIKSEDAQKAQQAQQQQPAQPAK